MPTLLIQPMQVLFEQPSKLCNTFFTILFLIFLQNASWNFNIWCLCCKKLLPSYCIFAREYCKNIEIWKHEIETWSISKVVFSYQILSSFERDCFTIYSWNTSAIIQFIFEAGIKTLIPVVLYENKRTEKDIKKSHIWSTPPTGILLHCIALRLINSIQEKYASSQKKLFEAISHNLDLDLNIQKMRRNFWG